MAIMLVRELRRKEKIGEKTAETGHWKGKENKQRRLKRIFFTETNLTK